MSNRVRHYMKEEAERLVPLLHDAYRAVGRFQKKRDSRNEQKLLEHLQRIGTALRTFQRVVQPAKQGYFDAILNTDLSTADRIIALDTAVGSLHIEFAVPRMYMHQESERCDAPWTRAGSWSRMMPRRPRFPRTREDGLLCRGIPASPGSQLDRWR